MGPFDVAVIAIIGGIIYKITNTYLAHKGTIAAEAEIELLRQELTQMKQRLHTLEAIVTDDGYDIKSEIDRL